MSTSYGWDDGTSGGPLSDDEGAYHRRCDPGDPGERPDAWELADLGRELARMAREEGK